MIISIILIYLIINSFYVYSWIRDYIDYTIIINYRFRKNILILVLYLIFFVFVLRLLGLLREHKILDLKLVFGSKDLTIMLLILILVYAVRRFINLYVKLVSFKIHYFLLSPDTIGFDVVYARFYINWVYTLVKKYFNVIRVINFILTLILIGLVIVDLTKNNLVLDLSLGYLRYFGIFKFCYICIRFIALKQDLVLDYYAYNLTYTYIDKEFWVNLDDSFLEKENRYRFEVIAK